MLALLGSRVYITRSYNRKFNNKEILRQVSVLGNGIAIYDLSTPTHVCVRSWIRLLVELTTVVLGYKHEECIWKKLE